MSKIYRIQSPWVSTKNNGRGQAAYRPLAMQVAGVSKFYESAWNAGGSDVSRVADFCVVVPDSREKAVTKAFTANPNITISEGYPQDA